MANWAGSGRLGGIIEDSDMLDVVVLGEAGRTVVNVVDDDDARVH